MASSLATDKPSLASISDTIPVDQDPFLSPPTGATHHRFSNFDTQLFALGPATSPNQAKSALEAHLAETERRIQEASKLGTTLVQQRKDLADRLKDVEQQQNEADITPELRQKLEEIEKEYNEVGRETARAFLPKSRVMSSEMGNSPFGDGKRSVSPSKFESQGSNSPSKLIVPSNRRQRNQPSNRVHDIEFATEISTSLLSQVRHLQALLAEKEEALKSAKLEKSRLEIDAEGLTERLRSLDESEQRYKDENWNLETQIHELLAAAKETADRERKLTQTLNVSQAEKSAAQKELDDIKSSHAKLSEDHAATVKHHEVELGSVKRSMSVVESERGALQRKIEDLISQNQELARAVAHQRGRLEDREQNSGLSDEDFETAADDITPEHSPPPSPVKGTPRHSMLESETLKSSLHHAHRMIQNLKGNIHREKTEKLELKRMLQDARDELDARRGEFGSGNGKRARKVDSKDFKKPLRPGQLGGMRNSRSEVFIEDANWEEDDGQESPTHATIAARIAMRATVGGFAGSNMTDSSDQFETANEQDTSDAFETANERATETEEFQTGHEELSGSDDLTETEGGPSTSGGSRPIALSLAGNRQSFQSSASTSDDDYDYEELKTPTAQFQPQRLRLKVNRGANRRSRAVSEEPQFQGSPASFANSSRSGTPHKAGQSLFAELGELGGSDEEDSVLDTPNHKTLASQSATPASRPSTSKNTPALVPSMPSVPRIPMVHSAMMTEPWEPEIVTPPASLPQLAEAGIAGEAIGKAAHLVHEKYSSTGTQIDTRTSDASSQWHEEPVKNPLKVFSGEGSRPLSTSTYSDRSSQYDSEVIDESLAKFPSPPTSRVHTPLTNLATFEPARTSLTMSAIVSEHVEPVESTRSAPLTISTITSEHVEPIESTRGEPLTISTINSEHVEPIESTRGEPLTMSTITSEHVEPVESTRGEPLTMSTITSEHVEPIEPAKSAPLMISTIASEHVEPIEPTKSAPLTISTIASEHVEPIEPAKSAPLMISTIASEHVEPIEPAKSAPLTMSTIASEHVEPIEPTKSAPLMISTITSEHVEPVESTRGEPLTISTIASEHVEPIESTKGELLKSLPEIHKPIPVPAILKYSSIQSMDTEPIEPRSPRRDEPLLEASNIKKDPETPKGALAGSAFGWNKYNQPATPIIAEDETRQSPSDSPMNDTPESLRPLKELSSNPRDRSPKRIRTGTNDGSVQTALTGMQIDEMLKAKKKDAVLNEEDLKVASSPRTPVVPKTPNARKSQDSIGSIGRARAAMAGPDSVNDNSIQKRPGSSSSRNNSLSGTHPPLPDDHKQVIAAATQRSGSSSGGPGSMGPPLIPASAYRANPSFRPRTPSTQITMSPGSLRGGTTPRPLHSSGAAEIQIPSLSGKSRASSVSSFASEIETRFNRNGTSMPQGLESNTDPRMINAITQTMIGEYLWKYTRKAGRGAMSENRHRRYFWVHPYTRTLYWSDQDPSSAGRTELKAKSVPIEAVRVVTDDNPMPPGLHRKSLVIITPGRVVKFTATTGQRHETWFNALSYLLLRNGEDAIEDTSEVANGSLTNEDVAEFNPSFENNGSHRGPTSLASYSSRTARNDSPGKLIRSQVGSTSSRPSIGTFSRLSSYWKPGKEAISGSFSSRRSKHSISNRGSVYEASEAHDSAEDLREIIEKQDQESDKIENVRACCDGRHDVGHLHTNSSKNRHSHTGLTSGSVSGRSSQPHTKSKNSLSRQIDD